MFHKYQRKFFKEELAYRGAAAKSQNILALSPLARPIRRVFKSSTSASYCLVRGSTSTMKAHAILKSLSIA